MRHIQTDARRDQREERNGLHLDAARTQWLISGYRALVFICAHTGSDSK